MSAYLVTLQQVQMSEKSRENREIDHFIWHVITQIVNCSLLEQQIRQVS